MPGCVTCELSDRRARDEAPPWDAIATIGNWDVAHAFGTSVEGWLVLVVRRHETAMADLTDDEAAELGPLIKRVSAALHSVLGCVKTYVVQFAEHPQHPHVHVHVIARAAELDPADIGPGIFRRMGLPPGECVAEDRMNQIAMQLRRHLGYQTAASGIHSKLGKYRSARK